jgi:PAS domain S-box-containing protein
LRILIVDDFEIVRRGVRALLATEPNFKICGEAVDGRDAIQKALELKPEAVVMDISMPNLNGLEATREIRRILPNVKIVILSQHNLPEMMKQAFAAGANGYVVKSAVSTDLLATLAQAQRGDSVPREALGPQQANIDVQEVLQRSNVFERALRETAERLRMAQQVARIGTFELNIKTGVTQWTSEMEALHGLQPGAFPGTYSAWQQLLHPEDRGPIVRAFERAAKTLEFEGEWRVVWPDGSFHWLLGRASLLRDGAGEPEHWVGVNIDITERRLSEERAEKLSRLLDLSFDAIVVRDAEDRVRYWNHGAKELYGWNAEEAASQVTHNLLQTEFPQSLETIFAALRGEGRWEGRLKHRCKDGRSVTVQSRWGLIRDWETGSQWVMETNTDITEREAAAHASENGHGENVQTAPEEIIRGAAGVGI